MQMPLYNRAAAVDYARNWTQGFSSPQNNNNPVWGPRRIGLDCTNFISQALYAGGWQMVAGPKQDNRVWWAEPLGGDRSYTWGGAGPFYNFLRDSGRAYWVNSPSQLMIGDVVQLTYLQGAVDHTMIVTKAVPPFSGNDIYLTYHSIDQRDISFNAMQAHAGRDYTPIFWKLKDYYFGYKIQRSAKSVVVKQYF
jgi:hypothetical protein